MISFVIIFPWCLQYCWARDLTYITVQVKYYYFSLSKYKTIESHKDR